jgi:hypothetical protein
LLKLRTKIAGLVLLCVAFDSWALTLGRLHGAVLLGQSLDVRVQIQMDASEDAAVSCFDAEVFHADTRQEGSRVHLAVEKFAQAGMAEVRVLSSALVAEPFITLNLHYGCGQNISRRYVLLADLPPQTPELSGSPAGSSAVLAPAFMQPELKSSTAVAGALPSLALAPSAAVPVAPANGKTVAPPKSGAAKRTVSPRHATNRDLAPSKRTVTDSKGKPGRTVNLSRLKLDPLEMLSDRIANLDSNMTFAPSEDALLNLQKMKALEGEVKALRDSAAKNERSLADLKVRLQQAEVERIPVAVIYGLGALVFFCLLALAWFWSRRRSATSDQWWSDAGSNQGLAEIGDVRGTNSRAATLRQSPDQVLESAALHAVATEAGNSSGLEAHSVHLSDSAFSDFSQSGQSGSELTGRPGQAAAEVPVKLVRSLNSDEILEIRRQAEKLVLLGLPEQAVAILKRQIGESDEPNPVVYLDLISLFHDLKMKNEYQQFCQDFSLLFNCRIPEFALFEDEGRGLESYPEALSSITASWPNPKVLELIEAFIYRDPWAVGSEPFDLAGMCDLLLLHGVAQSIVLASVSADEDQRQDQYPASDAQDSQPAQLDYADSVASSFPALSKSALADLFGPEKELPQELDLDLSDLRAPVTSARVGSASDIDLSRLIPNDHEAHDRAVIDINLRTKKTSPRSPDKRLN